MKNIFKNLFGANIIIAIVCFNINVTNENRSIREFDILKLESFNSATAEDGGPELPCFIGPLSEMGILAYSCYYYCGTPFFLIPDQPSVCNPQ